VTKNGKDGEGSFNVRCILPWITLFCILRNVTDRDSRLKLLRDWNRCFLCLKIGHYPNTCDITKKCRHCSGRHHQSICNNPSNNRQQCDDKKVHENRNSNQGPEGSHPPTTAAITQTTKGSVFLQTARATVSNGWRLIPYNVWYRKSKVLDREDASKSIKIKPDWKRNPSTKHLRRKQV
jgi:hypothetical protein